jgi:hypothetical protein
VVPRRLSLPLVPLMVQRSEGVDAEITRTSVPAPATTVG